MTASRFVRVLFVALAAGIGGPAGAITITPSYEASYMLGGQDVTALVKMNFDAAVDWWRMALPTPLINLTIDVRLANIGGANLAGNTIYDTKDANGRVDKSTIQFNTNAPFFLDPTPKNDSEFNLAVTNINTNPMTMATVNAGRRGPAVATAPAAAKTDWDFLSVAKHEIGHALGIGFNGADPANYVLYSNEVADNDIDIDAVFAPLFPGNILPVLAIPTTGSHIDGGANAGLFNNTLLATPGFLRGERALQSSIDILAIGSVYNLPIGGVNMNPIHIPEPNAFALMFFALAMGATRAKR